MTMNVSVAATAILAHAGFDASRLGWVPVNMSPARSSVSPMSVPG